jgi:hypothetical protein
VSLPDASSPSTVASYNITRKATGERIKMDEVALYTVRDGKNAGYMSNA